MAGEDETLRKKNNVALQKTKSTLYVPPEIIRSRGAATHLLDWVYAIRQPGDPARNKTSLVPPLDAVAGSREAAVPTPAGQPSARERGGNHI